MELRKLTEDDLKKNIGLLSYAYKTNKDLFPLFFEYEYDGEIKYLYCYDNWFTVLYKDNNQELIDYEFALDDEYELLYSRYEDFYVDHKSNGYDTIIDLSKRMYIVIKCGKVENSKTLQDGYITFTQAKYDKPDSLSMIFPIFHIENRKIYKDFLNKPNYYYFNRRFHAPMTYIREDVDYSEKPIFFNLISIREYGLYDVLKNGSVSLQKSNNITRYFKVPFNNDYLNGIYASFSSNFYDEQSLEVMIKNRGFFTEIPDSVLSYYNGEEKRLDEFKSLAGSIKEYYSKNKILLVLNLDREVIR